MIVVVVMGETIVMPSTTFVLTRKAGLTMKLNHIHRMFLRRLDSPCLP